MTGDLPSAVLFACSHNVIRSPMAEGLMKHMYGHKVYVDSCGVRICENDGFAIAAMNEIGIDISRHQPTGFDDLEDTSYDLVISLSPEAHHQALELTRTMAIEAEYWPTFDPSDAQGNREQMLDSYRQVRDQLLQKIRSRFGDVAARGI